jgi:predicted TIM-barrel fold metal-dependent hydrolase
MLVDVNVNLSRWPSRRLPHDEPRLFVEKLKSLQVTQAWTGSFEGLLHRDLAGVNTRLADECNEFGGGLLLPFGTVNPTLPDWEEDVRRCAEVHRMRGLRLFPNYHGYTLDDPRFAELLGQATDRHLIVQVAVSMEDDRTQHPLLRASPVDVRPLIKLLGRLPSCRLVLLNALRSIRLDDLPALVAAGRLYVEIANLEGVAGIEKLLQHVPHDRILFGSHFPFFYGEAAWLKIRESELAGLQRESILHSNAARLLENKA